MDPRLVELLTRLAASRARPADIRRALVAESRELRIAPPSYEHVRRLVQAIRSDREVDHDSACHVMPVAIDVLLGFEHGSELVRVGRGERRRIR